MSTFLPWMEDYLKINEETEQLWKRYDLWCSDCGNVGNCKNYRCQELRKNCKLDFYRKADKRKMLLVRNKLCGVIFTRHIIHVVDNAEERLEEVKEDYYSNYVEIPGDEFLFFTSYQAVIDFLNSEKTATELQEDERVKFNEKSKKN